MLDVKHKILVAGANGMVGSAIVRLLQQKGFEQLLIPSRHELDYTDQSHVRSYLQSQKPDVVVVAAAKVGGIWANMSYPAEFIYDNLMIECNLIHESHGAGVDRLLFLGSTCIYPRESSQPMVEEALLSGPLEKTNEAYAIAKIAGIKMCQFYRQQYGRRYISAMPTNLYGPGDNYHPKDSHVIAALMRRFHEAKEKNLPEVEIWGTGEPRREFLYVDDLAKACLFLLQNYDETLHLNIGSEEEVTILELTELIAEVIGYKGKITHDLTKPDGTMRKKTALNRILQLGWKPCISLKEGLQMSYRDFMLFRCKS